MKSATQRNAAHRRVDPPNDADNRDRSDIEPPLALLFAEMFLHCQLKPSATRSPVALIAAYPESSSPNEAKIGTVRKTV